MTELPAYIGLALVALALPALGPLVLFRVFARTVRRA
jgi:hypothetical protein